MGVKFCVRDLQIVVFVISVKRAGGMAVLLLKP
jgi:hypothetical protein